ncbi:cell division protein FtsX [Paenibacillus yonginensis]|uniref:Cell division protein FtsX n=1 Tax=Paenibacillus yonginensis TaxID=1462996 RepID=A0A1B1N3T9_9BACL|nr:permease-like cell division protein FtsX [Paenibacillus yonginensis]ANS76065.1 cell division protein FtsX [Paenibacillus yonginensis]
MTFRTFLRHLREGMKNVFRNGWMSVASITSIIVSLFILGVFVLLVINVNSFADEADSQVQISAFLNTGVDGTTRQQLQTAIESMPEVSKVTFVDKAQGLKDLREKLGADGNDLLEGYTEETNPIPDTLKVEVIEPSTVSFVAGKIQDLNKQYSADQQPIYKVRYGKGTVEKLFKVTRLIRNIGFAFVAGLGLMAMFLISNTIRVTILARRREIGIMKLVGATNSFIRWPFFVEGALIGLIGSLVTAALLFAGYQTLENTIGFDVTLNFRLVPLRQFGYPLGGLLVLLGVLIGVWGSTVSIRKFLKV